MYILIETVGYKINISCFLDEKVVEKELRLRYNEAVRKAQSIDWKRTYYIEEKKYARVNDWHNNIEYRIGKIDDKERR